jgi:hypothetical protein
MVGLSNMLNLMNVTKDSFPTNHPLSNNLGGIDKAQLTMAHTITL